MRVLNGGKYKMIITNTAARYFEYRLVDNLENPVLEGDGFDSEEDIIKQLSELSDALRAIFG